MEHEAPKPHEHLLPNSQFTVAITDDQSSCVVHGCN